MSDSAFALRSGLRPTPITRQPRSSSLSAAALPMPALAPVITATFWSVLAIARLILVCVLRETVFMCYPLHETVQWVHAVPGIPDRRTACFAETGNALCACARQPVAVVCDSPVWVEPHGLCRDVHIPNCIIETLNANHVRCFVNRVEID